MKINLSEYIKKRNNIVEWSIIHMMSRRESDLNNIPEWKMDYNGGPFTTKSVDITLTIEGVEVDFIEVIEEIDRHNNEMIVEQAKTLLDEKYSGIYEKIEDLKNIMDETLQNAKSDFNARTLV